MELKPLVRLTWVATSRHGSELPDAVIDEHLDALSRLRGVGRVAAYQLVALDSVHRRLKANLHLLGADSSDPRPDLLLLSEVESIRVAVDAEDEIRNLPLESGHAKSAVVGRALLMTAGSVAGVHDSVYEVLGPAVQVGIFNMDSPESERQLSYWYEYQRFLPFTSLEGGIRARRFLSVWGPSKFGVIYEFVSRAAHSEFIAMLEAPAHDSSHVTGNVIPHTVHHPVLSQSVGVQVPVGRVVGSRELRSA